MPPSKALLCSSPSSLSSEDSSDADQHAEAPRSRRTGAGKLDLLPLHGDVDAPLKINKAYAEEFERRKARELLSAARNLPQEEPGSSESSSEGEEEDDVAVELDDDVDRVIHETIRLIQEKDPRVYDPNFKPFENLAPKASSVPSSSRPAVPKPLKYADSVRQRAATLGPEVAEQSSSEDEDDNVGNRNRKATADPSYQDEAEMAKRNFVAALREKTNGTTEEGEEEEDDDDLLKPVAKKTTLAGAMKSSSEARPLNLYQAPPMADSDEQFLWKYLRDRAWMTGGTGDQQLWTPALKEDEEDVERQERFETAYNFRFEEPGGTKLVSHARKVEGSLRRPDDTRKQRRERAKQRKEEEEMARLEELKRLKGLRRKLIEEELAKSFEVGGVAQPALGVEDIDEDFDPDKWDAKMAQVFNDDYYALSDDDFNVDDEDVKIIDEDEPLGASTDAAVGEPEAAADFAVAAASVPSRSKAKAEPLKADGGDENEEAEEGGFRYRQVPANSYGLSVDEILLADQAALNRFVSLKRLAPYREKEWHPAPQHRFAFRQALKRTIKDIRATPKASVKRQRLRIAGLPGTEDAHKLGRSRLLQAALTTTKPVRAKSGASKEASGKARAAGTKQSRLESYGL